MLDWLCFYSIVAPMTLVATDRRAAIEALLRERPVHSQAELLDLLAERGFECSQPALSRDLRALGVAKVAGAYQLVEGERVTPLTTLRSLLREARAVQHLVLVRCEPGAASAVARALEAEELPGMLGTLAGDDTVLVAVQSQADGARVTRRVEELL
jgi:transcriptional regulator of arginine metabolism